MSEPLIVFSVQAVKYTLFFGYSSKGSLGCRRFSEGCIIASCIKSKNDSDKGFSAVDRQLNELQHIKEWGP